jgi:hypothetical protein
VSTSESAAVHYEAMVLASEERQQLLATHRRPQIERTADRWRPGANRFREHPFRENETLTELLRYIQPNDTVLDVGGGAGRYLPIALRCKELINIEPSAGMGLQFEASVLEAAINNARWLQSDWLDADLEGDVTFCANVVYYVADIVPFISKLHRASRRRVMIVMHSLPPVNAAANLSSYVYGIEPALDPGQAELLPVLWEMGILPDVRVLGPSDFIANRIRFADRDEAIASVIPDDLVDELVPTARASVEAHFEELFVPAADGGFRRRSGASRVLLITWETPDSDD